MIIAERGQDEQTRVDVGGAPVPKSCRARPLRLRGWGSGLQARSSSALDFPACLCAHTCLRTHAHLHIHACAHVCLGAHVSSVPSSRAPADFSPGLSIPENTHIHALTDLHNAYLRVPYAILRETNAKIIYIIQMCFPTCLQMHSYRHSVQAKSIEMMSEKKKKTFINSAYFAMWQEMVLIP